MVTSETAVDQIWVGGGSFCAETSPAMLISCHSSSSAIGLIRRSQPRLERLGEAGARAAAAAVTGTAAGAGAVARAEAAAACLGVRSPVRVAGLDAGTLNPPQVHDGG